MIPDGFHRHPMDELDIYNSNEAFYSGEEDFPSNRDSPPQRSQNRCNTILKVMASW